jgi:hypothetical protein
MQQDVQWRPLHGYEGFYEVSDSGSVRSIDRTIDLPDNKRRKIKGRTLAIKKNRDGYQFVSVSRNGKQETMYVHRAVAKTYLPNPDDLPQVNHLDGNKLNNNVRNLAWVTHPQNVQHCYDTGLCKNKGGNHTFAVGVIDNSLGQEFSTIKEWCEARGISYSTGRNLLSGYNGSKTIDLSAIVKQLKRKTND